MKKTVDVIFLSHCPNEEYFELNKRCLASLFHSEKDISFTITFIESNPNFDETVFSYPFDNIRVIKPGEPFHFNRHLNIGLQQAKAEWVVFSNNDVIFHEGWLSEIFKIKALDTSIQSFCPFDRTSPYLSYEEMSRKPYHIGYRVPIEFVGWCFVTERSLFDKTGKFDETFDLYFQDNDFALTLQKQGIVHALVSNSFVEHIGGYTTKLKDASMSERYAQGKAKFTQKWHRNPFRVFKERLIRLFSAAGAT
jgi:GT2 family glycosyltransferase